MSEGPAAEQHLVLLLHRGCEKLRVRHLKLLHQLLLAQHRGLGLRHDLSVQTGKGLNVV